ncbi:MAG TPA: hypothetical protein PK913_15560 [Phenylobacterium sp.]|nr:hypothetical protein [Phenylobacterium sp.]
MFDLTYTDRLPLVPEAILRQHKVHEPHDTRFRAAARLLQALWRDRRDIPMGFYVNGKGRKTALGSRLSAFAAAAGANFLSPDLQRLTRRELAYREPGAMIDEHRVWSNMLSSMPLTFNLFGGLKLNRDLAHAVCRTLWPELVQDICHIQFEHSPGRGDRTFTDDGTAFDVLLSCRDAQGAKTFVAIEVKYSEAMVEPAARGRPRYEELSETCGLYHDPADPTLRTSPYQQLWREHMLAEQLISSGLYDRGVFVCLAPRLNHQVQQACVGYAQKLFERDGACGFDALPLEEMIGTIREAGAEDFAAALHERYSDFTPVHALI